MHQKIVKLNLLLYSEDLGSTAAAVTPSQLLLGASACEIPEIKNSLAYWVFKRESERTPIIK